LVLKEHEMIDPTVEELIPITKAAKAISPSRPPNAATVWRWAMHGVRGVTLENVIVGGQRFTSREAIGRFLQALNEPGAMPAPPNRQSEADREELRRRGYDVEPVEPAEVAKAR
jgi:hypothetical protein